MFGLKKKPLACVSDPKEANAVLAEIKSGNYPTLNVSGFPINLQKNEQLVWIVQHCESYVMKKRRVSGRRSKGFSVRIAKGFWWHEGGSRGSSQDVEYMELIGQGILALSTRHLYFWTPDTVVKEPYTKIVSFSKLKDGFQIQRATATARLRHFVTGKRDTTTFAILEHLAQVA